MPRADIYLTLNRRRVLAELEQAGVAVGAYEIADQIKAQYGGRCAPMTIYRALEALVAHGLVRYLPAQKKYVRAQLQADKDDFVLTLYCRQCSGVTERIAPEIAAALKATGVIIRCNSVAVDGLCSACG